jgi:hypothetical protein
MLLSHQKVTCSCHNIAEKQQSFTQFIQWPNLHSEQVCATSEKINGHRKDK